MEERADVQPLVERAKAGDRAAFDLLVETYRERLHSRIRSRIGIKLRGRVHPDDVFQEACLRAFESLGRFQAQSDDSFYHWLCGIAEHLLWNASQKRSGCEGRLVHDVSASTVSAGRQLRREERMNRLQEAMRGLSEDQREAIQLAKIDGLKVREIAARMDRTPDSVKQLLSRGLRQLKQTIGETESLRLPDRGLELSEPDHAE